MSTVEMVGRDGAAPKYERERPPLSFVYCVLGLVFPRVDTSSATHFLDCWASRRAWLRQLMKPRIMAMARTREQREDIWRQLSHPPPTTAWMLNAALEKSTGWVVMSVELIPVVFCTRAAGSTKTPNEAHDEVTNAMPWRYSSSVQRRFQHVWC